jgi:hypothetical protein
MRLLCRIFALCLALAWVPVTGHCRIEALGVDFAACSDDCHEPSPAGAAHDDGCALIESGLYKTGSGTITVRAPAIASLCAFCDCSRISALGPVLDPGTVSLRATHPRDWVPAWHFVQRAAPSPRAPSVVVA